ncbi:hypothetical protein JI528_15825, partial [Listeria monocytogenes]|nr:hypothetical protein [Listeria monocytogenes]
MFLTNHELQKIEVIDYDDLKEMVNQEAVTRFRMGGMNPNHPTVSGTA